MWHLYKNTIVGGAFALVCFVLYLFFPATSLLESFVSVLVFFLVLPLLYGKVILGKDTYALYGIVPIKPTLQTVVRALTSLTIVALASYGISKLSIIGYYTDIVADTFSLPGMIIVDLIAFGPLLLLFAFFAYGFVSAVLQQLPTWARSSVSTLLFLFLTLSLLTTLTPTAPLWFFVPLFIPLLFWRQKSLEKSFYPAAFFTILAKILFDIIVLLVS